MSLFKPKPLGKRVSSWGEGPVWWNGRLFHVDIQGQALVQVEPNKGKSTEVNLDQQVGFCLPCQSGAWIWGGEKGLYRFNPEDGSSTPLVDPEPDLPNNRFNDAAISPDGRLFAGTIAMDKQQGAASLYRYDPDGSIVKVLDGLTNSNGMDWSPDGRTCYHIDTPTRTIQRYPYHEADGSIGDGDCVVETDPVIDASPDGMCVDEQGHLWVAFCHGACVIRFHAVTGRELARIELPCTETTSCCFGGETLQDLYITTGVKDHQEEGGRLFVVRELGISGRPQTAFQDTE